MSIADKISLYPYQEKTIDDIRREWKENKRILAMLPCGAGKTFIAAYMINNMIKSGLKVLFLTPRIVLIDQAINEFIAFGIPVGDISKIHCSHKTNYGAKVIVASTASFIRKDYMPFDVIFVDECHLQNKKINQRMEEHPEERYIGLSATPYSKGLGKYYTALVKGPSMRDLIDMEGGGLCDFDLYCPSIPSLKDVTVRNGDYVEKELERVMCGAKIAADVVANWCENAENRETIITPVNVAHAHKLQQEFADCGIVSEVIHARVPLEEREEIFNRVRNGTLKILISVACISEGFSIKTISCYVNARPTKSKSTWVQSFGRAIRYIDGKRALIFDHGGTALTLGLPELIDVDHLDDGTRAEAEKKKEKQKKDQEALPKVCKQCGALRKPGEIVCHKCGYKSVYSEDVEVNRQLGLKIFKGEKKKEATKEDKQRWYSELKGWEKQQNMMGKNINPYQVNNIYKEKFGVYPRGLDDTAASPSREITGFITSRKIAYSKAMKAKEGL
jgi:DNA repair protein RadD